ncbi:hypothetical protein IQ265_11600 [Nodosilinea sp. LEGE 06152]|uniref:hypothetical protein n=1 Tax=Nodosilinea sp. LEGE 06152 TaxID=2777966 RepID=UPI00187E3E74|nr:hypothetical protein [Nodosilinea sp. LEGE 06152]MBE9157463.1 hypothetical protein [Nodosilinea sp. LEGE 06152]
MAMLTFKKLGRLVAIAVLCLSLWSCGLVNPRPPRAVVEMAIAQKLSQTQAVLYRQLESAISSSELAQVGSIRIADHHWTTLANQPAVEVAGTYHLKGGQLTAAQRRQTRAFDLYLRRGDSKDQWLMLEPVLGRSGEALRWQSTPLTQPHVASVDPA